MHGGYSSAHALFKAKTIYFRFCSDMQVSILQVSYSNTTGVLKRQILKEKKQIYSEIMLLF